MAYSQRKPVGFEAITVSSTSIGPTATTFSPANASEANNAYFRCETANVRWRDDGTAPSATVGHLLQAGESLEYDGNVRSIRFIRVSVDASVTASYYRVAY